MDRVRVRFAPSPTGYLHIGHARTALYNWLFARRHGGTFILRVEDTDRDRSTPEAIDHILDGLTWLGLDWDEGPYFQSENQDRHAAAAQQLIQSGHAYKCFCDKAELEEKRRRAEAEKRTYRYDRTCRHLSPEQIEQYQREGRPYSIRFATPLEGSVAFQDEVHGAVVNQHSEIEDFILVRSDGQPLYLFSNAVDDLADGITHVIRGQDGVRNAPRQVLIYQALDVEPPVFAHVNLTLDPGRAKISKRKHGEAVTVDFYRRRGFLPWALLNFLLLLGWSSQSDQEFFSRSEAIERFSLSGLTKANSVFDYRPGDPKFFTDPKAISINAHYLRTMPIEDLEPLVVDELKETGLWRPEYKDGKRDWFLGVLELIRARFHTLKDFTGPGRPYFTDDFDYDPAAIKKNLAKDDRLAVWLPELAERLKGMSFDTGPLEKQIRDFAEEKGVKAGLIINAVRTAVTGQLAGPGLFDILAAVGRESTVRRLERTPQLF